MESVQDMPLLGLGASRCQAVHGLCPHRGRGDGQRPRLRWRGQRLAQSPQRVEAEGQPMFGPFDLRALAVVPQGRINSVTVQDLRLCDGRGRGDAVDHRGLSVA